MLLSPRLDLFVPTARFPCFRQPVLLNAGDHLLAFAENRNVSSCAPSISSNEIGSLQLRRSADNGATWTAMQQVWRGNIDFYTAVHDMRGTTILMLQEGAATNVFNSTDFGASWSAPTPLSVPLPPGVTSIKPAVGHGVQLQPDLCASPCREAGRLVLPFVCQNASGCGDRGGSSCAACALLSDDGGASWRVGGLGQPSSRESQLVQTASATTSASLYISERNMGPTAGHRLFCSSADGGETFGGCGLSSLVTPVTAHWTGIVASVQRLGAGGRRLAYAAPSLADQRANLTLRVSRDAGVSWDPAAAVIHSGPAAYSDMARVNDGVAVLFENGEATFADRVSLVVVGASS